MAGDRTSCWRGGGQLHQHDVRKWALHAERRSNAGNTFFDIIGSKGDDPTNTIGTDWGFPFRVEGGDPLTGEIVVTYENGLHVAGQTRASDTFTKMTVDYSGLEGGGLFGTTIFKTDLDELAVPGDLSAVPLPAGMPLLLLAFGTLGLVHRRKA